MNFDFSNLYYENQQMVEDYHLKFGLVSGDTYALDPDLLNLRMRLIEEEVTEFFDAVDSDLDEDQILKEMADILYVIYGMAVTYGWDLPEAFFRVHINNMERGTQDDGTIKRREDGKIIKNPNTRKVYLKDLV